MDKLIRVAADTAMRAAADYLITKGLRYDLDALVARIRSWIKIKLPEALRDAQQALDANMPQIAAAAFLASMRLAGIEAAKEAGRQ